MQGHIAPLLPLIPLLEAMGYECVVLASELARVKVESKLTPTARFLSLGPAFRSEEEELAIVQKCFSPYLDVPARVKTYVDVFCGERPPMIAHCGLSASLSHLAQMSC